MMLKKITPNSCGRKRQLRFHVNVRQSKLEHVKSALTVRICNPEDALLNFTYSFMEYVST